LRKRASAFPERQSKPPSASLYRERIIYSN
jgi:hypothetical protein